jgi:anti-sigma-K factor RskA
VTVDQDRFVELAPDYALGLLEGDDLEQFERHLAAGCEACELELARMDAVGDALAYAAPGAPAPDALRDRVLGAVYTDLEESKARAIPTAPPIAAPVRPGPAVEMPKATYSPSPWPPPDRAAAPPAPAKGPGFWGRLAPALAFAGVLAAALTGVYAYQLRQQLTLVRSDLERVTAENQELARVMDVVGSPRLRVIALGGQAGSPASEGHVLWSPDSKKAVLYAYGLPRPPAGKDYQLWVIAGGTPRSEGVFPVDARGQATHVLPDVPDPAGVGAFAVTLEPAGGLAQPSGPMFLLGAVAAKVD